MKHLLYGSRLMLSLSMLYGMILSTPAFSDPVIAFEGGWKGTCDRNGKSANVALVMDSVNASFNGKPVTSFSRRGTAISFVYNGRQFSGDFSNDTKKLTAKLQDGNKAADCNLTRLVENTGRLCILNTGPQTIWVRADSDNGAVDGPIRIFPNQTGRLSGSRDGGKVCWDAGDIGKTSCPRQQPQSTYAC